jgi:hypothetical protein
MELAFAQPSCPDVQTMLVSSSLSVVSKKFGAVEVLGDVSTGVFRPLLPARFRAAAVWSLYSIHHPGVRASRRLVCASFCWPRMGNFVSALIKNCIHCPKAKVHLHVSLQAAHIPVPIRCFSHIHVDLVGPLPRSSGYSYLFTLIDRTTRWPRRRIRSHPSPPPTAQRHSYKAGFRDSEYLEPSQATEAHNSPRLCGPICAPSSTSLTNKPLPTIPSLTASWNASTAA